MIAIETIIAAGISATVTLIVSVISNRAQSNRTEALLEYKLDELTKRVDKHNNIVERTYELERKEALNEKDIRVANHRIDDLEQKGE